MSLYPTQKKSRACRPLECQHGTAFRLRAESLFGLPLSQPEIVRTYANYITRLRWCQAEFLLCRPESEAGRSYAASATASATSIWPDSRAFLASDKMTSFRSNLSRYICASAAEISVAQSVPSVGKHPNPTLAPR